MTALAIILGGLLLTGAVAVTAIVIRAAFNTSNNGRYERSDINVAQMPTVTASFHGEGL